MGDGALLGQEPSPDERRDRLRLIRSENVGPRTYRALMAAFGTATAALAAAPALSRRGGRRRAIKLCLAADAERELAALDALGARLLTLGEADYPVALAAIDDAPAVLTMRGAGAMLARPAVAVVGARNASVNGRKLADDLARGLGAAGLVVVSGLARGIDGAAHAGALATGTVAVMAGGVDVVYPPQHEALYAAILEAGAVVSEMPPGLSPQARYFPRRNRIIAGLSLGVVVVEAARRSGSLITARLALEQGREVFAVPGSPLDPRAGGTNQLIKNGAVLTENARDVVDELRPMLRVPLPENRGLSDVPTTPPEPAESEVSAVRQVVMDSLSPSPVAVDEIIRRCQLSPSIVQMVLLELELAGRVERQAGNRVAAI